MARENMGSDVPKGLIQRVAEGVRYALTGVGPEAWFGPMQPIAPQAQEQTEGRAFDYPVGLNLRTQPREGEAISFRDLRALADGYDLLRLVIETRKDQVESFDWEIVPAKKDASAAGMKDDIELVTDFFQSPDKEHEWPQWLRLLLEEVLVTDAACVYPRQTRGGGVYGFELLDGSTIKRVIDAGGRTPLPPEPAYQQILKGIPAADYSRDDLVYAMRNPRVWKLYGFSPVEQVITTVNIALRRQMTQLAFYTEGNVPEALAQVPTTWTMPQIKDFQLWWDSVMSGNIAQRSRMRFIPNLDNIVFPKDAVLKDEMDEWLARIVCFAFSISPSALIKQVNRASGEQMADTAKEEGLMPLLRFVETVVTGLIAKHLKQPGLKFQFKIVNRVTPVDQAKIHEIYSKAQVLTPDEVREDLGKEPMADEDRAKAFPPTPPPGHSLDEDGKPVPLPGTVLAATKGKPDEPKEKEPTPAEKMLATALSMLDPQQLAKVASAMRPTVVEVKPHVDVVVGDTNVHLPGERQ